MYGLGDSPRGGWLVNEWLRGDGVGVQCLASWGSVKEGVDTGCGGGEQDLEMSQQQWNGRMEGVFGVVSCDGGVCFVS